MRTHTQPETVTGRRPVHRPVPAILILALASLLGIAGCFGGKDSKLSQNPGEATLEGAGTSVVDLNSKGTAQQVGYAASANSSSGAVNANFLTTDSKEYVDQINYARLKQSLPPRPGASVNSVSFEQFLKTDYGQLNKNPPSSPGVSEPFAEWANKSAHAPHPSVAQAAPPAAPQASQSAIPPTAGVTEVAFASAQPAPARAPQQRQVAMANQPAMTKSPVKAQNVSATANSSQPQLPLSGQPYPPAASTMKSPLVAKYTQPNRGAVARTEQAPFVGATLVTKTPAANATSSASAAGMIETSVRIELEEARMHLDDGQLLEAQQKIQAAKNLVTQMAGPISPKVVRDIALASLEVERRVGEKSTSLAMASSPKEMNPTVCQVKAGTQAQNTSLSSNASIAKLTGGSSVRITPRTSFIDLSRDAVNSPPATSAASSVDEFSAFQNSVAKSNQSLELPAMSGTSAMPRSNSFWSPEPSPISGSPANGIGTSGQSDVAANRGGQVNSFSNLPMQLPTSQEFAMADRVTGSGTLAGTSEQSDLPAMPALTAPQVTFQNGAETVPIIETPTDLSSVPSPRAAGSVEARDSRLQIPSWITYAVIISLIGLLTLAFRRM